MVVLWLCATAEEAGGLLGPSLEGAQEFCKAAKEYCLHVMTWHIEDSLRQLPQQAVCAVYLSHVNDAYVQTRLTPLRPRAALVGLDSHRRGVEIWLYGPWLFPGSPGVHNSGWRCLAVLACPSRHTVLSHRRGLSIKVSRTCWEEGGGVNRIESL